MNPTRRASIEAAIAALDAQGQAATNRALYERVGGSYSELAAYIKERRAGQASVAVSEDPMEPRPGPVQAPQPVSAPVLQRPRLAILAEAVHEAQALLTRLTRERDFQQTELNKAVMAQYQARREGQRLVRDLRRATVLAQSAPAYLKPNEEAKMAALQAQLAALVGADEAQAVMVDGRHTPDVLRER